mgnify:CR=1 FL=1
MNERDSVLELVARVDKTLTLLHRIKHEYQDFLATDFTLMGKKNTSAIVIAKLIVDYYTCAETLFLRISQFFENELNSERWHSNLLEKMTLQIEGVRNAVISETTEADLAELMRFRHFSRYYFELEYDWDKLDYLQKTFNRASESLPKDLGTFKLFLRRLVDLNSDTHQ